MGGSLWNGVRVAISGRATARERGARTACAAPRRRGLALGANVENTLGIVRWTIIYRFGR